MSAQLFAVIRRDSLNARNTWCAGPFPLGRARWVGSPIRGPGLPQSVSLRSGTVPVAARVTVHKGSPDTARLRWDPCL